MHDRTALNMMFIKKISEIIRNMFLHPVLLSPIKSLHLAYQLNEKLAMDFKSSGEKNYWRYLKKMTCIIGLKNGFFGGSFDRKCKKDQLWRNARSRLLFEYLQDDIFFRTAYVKVYTVRDILFTTLEHDYFDVNERKLCLTIIFTLNVV